MRLLSPESDCCKLFMSSTDQQRATHHQPQRLPSKVRAAAFYDLNSLKRHQVAQEGLPAKRPRTPSFNPLHCCFKTFKTQQAAFDFLDRQTCAPILRTFACETAATGQRDFIVTSAELFWQHYIETPAKERHFYEIIRQSSPCNLYFDLEYHPEFNPAVNGAQLVTLLVTGVKDLLYELFGIPWDANYVLELDSSTASKFSRHLIICLPGLAFADACHAGRFARCVLLRLLHTAVHSSQYGQLLVHNKDGGLTTFVDMGVYTRNRAFRLYLSSKFGKAAVLRTTHRFRGAILCPKAAFMDSLVSVLKPCCIPASSTSACFSTSSSQRQQDRRSQWRPALLLLRVEDDGQQELLQLPLAWQQVAMLQLKPLPHCQHMHTATAAAAVHSRSTAGGVHGATPEPRSHGPLTHLTGLGMLQASGQPCTGPSPLPLLDRFIGSICSAGGVQGEVRSWLLQPGSSCVLYNIKNNRWCGNVGRPHKSNGIYFCVDLSAGVYYQKCYDPECRLYRSEQMPLPTDVWMAYRHLCVPSDTQAAPQQQQGDSASVLMPTAATSSSLTQSQLAEGHGRPPAALDPAGAQHAVGTSAISCAGAHNSRTAAGCVLLPQPQPTAAGSCMADDVDDDECHQLLLQIEQQQRQQEQPEQSRCALVLTLTGDAGSNHQPSQPANNNSQAGFPLASQELGGEQGLAADEDELCVQLLREVEQQHITSKRSIIAR